MGGGWLYAALIFHVLSAVRGVFLFFTRRLSARTRVPIEKTTLWKGLLCDKKTNESVA